MSNINIDEVRVLTRELDKQGLLLGVIMTHLPRPEGDVGDYVPDVTCLMKLGQATTETEYAEGYFGAIQWLRMIGKLGKNDFPVFKQHMLLAQEVENA